MPLIAPPSAANPGGAALRQGAAEKERHVRSGRQGDDHHREHERQQDRGVGHSETHRLVSVMRRRT